MGRDTKGLLRRWPEQSAVNDHNSDPQTYNANRIFRRSLFPFVPQNLCAPSHSWEYAISVIGWFGVCEHYIHDSHYWPDQIFHSHSSLLGNCINKKYVAFVLNVGWFRDIWSLSASACNWRCYDSILTTAHRWWHATWAHMGSNQARPIGETLSIPWRYSIKVPLSCMRVGGLSFRVLGVGSSATCLKRVYKCALMLCKYAHACVLALLRGHHLLTGSCSLHM